MLSYVGDGHPRKALNHFCLGFAQMPLFALELGNELVNDLSDCLSFRHRIQFGNQLLKGDLGIDHHRLHG